MKDLFAEAPAKNHSLLCILGAHIQRCAGHPDRIVLRGKW